MGHFQKTAFITFCIPTTSVVFTWKRKKVSPGQQYQFLPFGQPPFSRENHIVSKSWIWYCNARLGFPRFHVKTVVFAIVFSLWKHEIFFCKLLILKLSRNSIPCYSCWGLSYEWKREQESLDSRLPSGKAAGFRGNDTFWMLRNNTYWSYSFSLRSK